jgi:predicted RNA binding protein YcfA (HicA-like mRNA interferase family)
MPKLKNLSGKDLLNIMGLFGFDIKSEKGSHIKLARINDGKQEIITIPNHQEIDKGTLKAIFRQSSHYIEKLELEEHFYTK